MLSRIQVTVNSPIRARSLFPDSSNAVLELSSGIWHAYRAKYRLSYTIGKLLGSTFQIRAHPSSVWVMNYECLLIDVFQAEVYQLFQQNRIDGDEGDTEDDHQQLYLHVQVTSLVKASR